MYYQRLSPWSKNHARKNGEIEVSGVGLNMRLHKRCCPPRWRGNRYSLLGPSVLHLSHLPALSATGCNGKAHSVMEHSCTTEYGVLIVIALYIITMTVDVTYHVDEVFWLPPLGSWVIWIVEKPDLCLGLPPYPRWFPVGAPLWGPLLLVKCSEVAYRVLRELNNNNDDLNSGHVEGSDTSAVTSNSGLEIIRSNNPWPMTTEVSKATRGHNVNSPSQINNLSASAIKAPFACEMDTPCEVDFKLRGMWWSFIASRCDII